MKKNSSPSPLTVQAMVQAALAEDIGSGDITAALIDAHRVDHFEIITRESMVLCGQAWATAVFKHLDAEVQLDWAVGDGERLKAGETLCTLKGNTRALLTGERTALNFLQTLSAVATQTAQLVALISHTPATLLDTRKTIPLWREAQKYAVRCGGGNNQRMGLYDAFLIKENHISACGSIQEAIATARNQHPDRPLQIEVETLDELDQALAAKPDMILCDNFSLDMLKTAVERNQGKVLLEASGGVTEAELISLANTGVDRISCGMLTKHIKAIDLSMRMMPTP